MKRDCDFADLACAEIKRHRLLFRPSALVGESWGGYLLRLASENHLQGVEALAMVLDMTWQKLLIQEPQQLLLSMGIALPPDCEIAVAPPQANACRVSLPSAGRTRRSRICPSCLATDELPHLRAAWEMPLATVCPLHDELLLDQCGHCGSDLDILRPSVIKCHCGAHLPGKHSRMAPGWVKRLSKVFAEADVDRAVPTFGTASYVAQKAARTCKWIASPEDPSIGRRRDRLIDREGFLESATLRALEPLLLNWPKAIASSLNKECRFVRGHRDDYAALGERLSASRFAAMREVVKAVKAFIPRSHKPWLVVNRRKGLPVTRESYGIKALMRATGHSYTALVSRIDAGKIPGASYVVDKRSGLKRFSIPSHVLDAVAREYRVSNDVHAAAAQVGCSADAIKGLVRAGCIAHASLLKSGSRYRLNPAELAEMASRLFAIAVCKPQSASAQRLYFSAWVQGAYRVRFAGHWRVLLDAICSRQLPLYSAMERPVQLNDLYLRRSDLDRVLAEAKMRKRGTT